MDPLDLLARLVAIPGPPGQEIAVREFLAAQLDAMGVASRVDAKGNLIANLGSSDHPKIVVTAHMDEIAMIVREVEPDGKLIVGALGGLFPWKLGEGPVQVLADGGTVDGVLSFGSIHTEDSRSNVRQADNSAINWDMARVVTGQSQQRLSESGVRPGSRVVVHPSRRGLTRLDELVSGYFMDDRADLVAWLLAIDKLKSEPRNVLFAATVSEEIGGHGALYLLHDLRPDVCIALELGPNTPDAPVVINDQPTVWVDDGYAPMTAEDGKLVSQVASGLGMDVQFQALSRGGSDASCAASHGLCARPITLGIPMENSHGYEVIDPGSMANLADLAVGIILAVSLEA